MRYSLLVTPSSLPHVILSVAKDLHKRHVNIGTFGDIITANETYNPIHNTASVLPADDNSPGV